MVTEWCWVKDHLELSTLPLILSPREKWPSRKSVILGKIKSVIEIHMSVVVQCIYYRFLLS